MKRERLPLIRKCHPHQATLYGVKCPQSGDFTDVQKCVKCDYFYMRIGGYVLCEYKERQNEKEFVIPVHIL